VPLAIRRRDAAERERRAREHLHIAVRQGVQAIGLLLVAIGLIIGFVAAIQSSSQTEQPAASLELNNDGTSVSGTAKVGDLSSKGRLTVLVVGLGQNPDGSYVPEGTLYRAFVGPNGNGDASETVHVPLPPNEYDAIGIQAFTAPNPAACGRVPTDLHRHPGTGCVIVQLPDRPTAPELSADWSGTSVIRVHLATNIARETPAGGWVLLRAAGTQPAPGRSRRGKQDHRPITLYTATLPTASTTISRDVSLFHPTSG
jgi:hypothetical protein